MKTTFFILTIICAASWLATAVFFRWLEKREKKSKTKIKIHDSI